MFCTKHCLRITHISAKKYSGSHANPPVIHTMERTLTKLLTKHKHFYELKISRTQNSTRVVLQPPFLLVPSPHMNRHPPTAHPHHSHQNSTFASVWNSQAIGSGDLLSEILPLTRPLYLLRGASALTVPQQCIRERGRGGGKNSTLNLHLHQSTRYAVK